MARKPSPAETADPREKALAALLAMEPELRQLDGLLMLLTVLSEATESIEPMALAALAHAGRSVHEELIRQWLTCHSVLKKP